MPLILKNEKGNETGSRTGRGPKSHFVLDSPLFETAPGVHDTATK